MFYFYGHMKKLFLIIRLSLPFNLVDYTFVNWNFKMVSDSEAIEFETFTKSPYSSWQYSEGLCNHLPGYN